jgi:hypothetical protein
MDLLKSLFTKLLSKLSKDILILLVLGLGAFTAHKIYKESITWKEEDVKWKLETTARQKKIEVGQRENRRENSLEHEIIIMDLGEVKQKQNVVVNTLTPADKKMIQQIHKDFEEQRKNKEQHKTVNDNSFNSTDTSYYNNNTEPILDDIQPSYEFVSPNVEDTLCSVYKEHFEHLIYLVGKF